MHNSQNPCLRKDIFTSINVKALTSYIAKRVGRSSNSNISEVPTFYQTKSTLPNITPELRATLARICATAYDKLPLLDALENKQHNVHLENLNLCRAFFCDNRGGAINLMNTARTHTSETLSFIARFAHYTPINFDSYYLFRTDKREYLVKCTDYPQYIGELAPYALVNIKGEVGEKCKEGIKLTNVQWGVV